MSASTATSAGALTVEAFSGFDGLEAARPFWRSLLRACQRHHQGDPLFNSPEWNSAYARSFAPPDEVFGWRISGDGLPLGLFAFRLEPSRGPFTLQRAILLADGTFDSDYLDLLIRPGFERPVLEQLVTELAREPRVEAAVLSGLPDESRALAALRAVLVKRRLFKRERPVPCLAAALPDSFTEHLESLKPRMRGKVKKAMRSARKKGATFVESHDPSTLDKDLNGLFDLHQKRWFAAGMPGSFADPRRRSFYARIAGELQAAGALRFHSLDWNGRAIACQLGAVTGDRYYQLQEGFDPGHEDLRPGIALRGMVIEELIRSGVRHYDFMEGDARSKRGWGAVIRPRTTVAFALPRWRARFAYGLRALVDSCSNDGVS